MTRTIVLLGLGLLALPDAVRAQADPHADHRDGMPGMTMPAAPEARQHPVPSAMPDMGGSDMGAMPGMAAGDHMMAMPAMLGPYSMNREASGTAWQPASSPIYASMFHAGGWMGMAQGYATLVHDDQGGPRGDTKTFSESMAMVMANRPVGGHGRLGLRAMLSFDPLMGRRGYPLLFATGETANGVTELVDRQHPHDLFMELAASYSHDLGNGRALFLYGGLPGEPALGPPTFMHRISGMDNPEAPIGHHWFDSTHITWGVVTGGYSTRTWKVEASAFKGREPDQRRWDIETPKLDSWSVRAFWNPVANLSLQASTGHLHSPEQLPPGRERAAHHRVRHLQSAAGPWRQLGLHPRLEPQGRAARPGAARLARRDDPALGRSAQRLRPRRARRRERAVRRGQPAPPPDHPGQQVEPRLPI